MKTYQIIPETEFQQQFALGTYAFNMEMTEERKASLLTTIQHSISLGAFSDEKLTAQILVTPFVVHFHQALYKMGGIGFVSSYPEYRGSGDVATLMKLAIETMNKEGLDLSYLAPFSYAFYRKYGFEQIFDQFKLTLTAEELPRVKTKSGYLKRLTWEEAQEAIKQLHEQRTANNVGSVQREDWWWHQTFWKKTAFKYAIYYNEDHKAEGYLVYWLKDDRFHIKEVVYLNHTAFEMIWGFIASHSGSFRYFEYLGGMNEQHAYLLANPRIQQEVIPSMMGRIINIERFIANYPAKTILKTPLYLEIQDELAPWNAGIWKLHFVGNQPKLTELSEEDSVDEAYLIKGDIQAWTQTLIGYRSVEELHFFNRLAGNQAAVQLLADFIPTGIPVLSDYF